MKILWLLSFLVVASQGQTITTSNPTEVWNPNIDQTTETEFVILQNSTNQTAHEPGCNELPTEEEYLECLRTFAFKIDTMEWILIFCHSVVFVTGLVCIV